MALIVLGRPQFTGLPVAGDKGNQSDSFRPVYILQETALGGKTNYRFIIKVWVDGAPLPGEYSYSPDFVGTVFIDIGAILRSRLNFSGVGQPGISLLGLHSIKYYIEYRAVWDTGNYGYVPDAANPRFAFNGVRHIVNAHLPFTFPNSYLNPSGSFGKFLLTTRNKLTVWAGHTFYLDSLVTGDGGNQFGYSILMPNDNTEIGVVKAQEQAPATMGIYGFTPVLYAVKNHTLTLITQPTRLLVTNNINSSRDLSPSGSSTIAQTFTMTSTFNGDFYFRLIQMFKGSVTNTSMPYTRLIVRLKNTAAGAPTTTIATQTLTFENISIDPATNPVVKFNANLLNGVKYAIEYEYDNTSLTGIVSQGLIFATELANSYAGGDLFVNGALIPNEELGLQIIYNGTITDTIPVEVKSECKNPVYLTWLSDLGGRMQWMFDYSQDESLQLNDYKALRKRIYATGLTREQWLALDDLNKIGDRYNYNRKIGSRVIDKIQNDEFNIVYVIPNTNSRRTLEYGSNSEFVIEYDDMYQNQVGA